jgi:NADH dehydrogenase [ubiquinone] 1 alpha subcomplex assembly factor 7
MKNLKKFFTTSKVGIANKNQQNILDLTRRPLAIPHDKLMKLSKFNNNENNEALKISLLNQIKLNGPIALDEYMKICLYDKKHGYYTTKEHIFGEKGDFITAPELSQMFGETIGIFIYKILENSFKFPKSWELLEIGAGRGFLMADILRSLIDLKSLEGLNAVIVEKSDKLAKVQQENIHNILLKKGIFTEYVYDKENKIDTFVDKKNRFTIKWFDSLDKYITFRCGILLEDASKNPIRNWNKFTKVEEISKLNPLIVINNELFDALPIKKFVYKESYWREVLIDVEDSNKENKKILTEYSEINEQKTFTEPKDKIKFKFSTSNPNNENVIKYLDPQNTFTEQGIKVKEGDSYEFSPEQIRYMYAICYLLNTTKHAQALIIDYGEDHAFSDSFRAIKKQKLYKGEDVLNFSGEADLTAYVNFRALKKVVNSYPNLKVGGLMKQGDFLEILQIYQRMRLLQSTTNDIKQKTMLNKQFEKLVNEDEMGDNYKFLYIHKKIHNPSYPFIDEILDKLENENK